MERLIALAGVLLLASVGSAGAESIATGCLAADGTIYSLRLYSAGTDAPCEAGDEIVRLAIHQPDTKFHKTQATVPFDTVRVLKEFGDETFPLQITVRYAPTPIGAQEPADSCELYVYYDTIVYLLASAPPHGDVNGLSFVVIFDEESREDGFVLSTTGAMQWLDEWAMYVHDLHVENREDQGCFVSYLIEFAPDPAALYSR